MKTARQRNWVRQVFLVSWIAMVLPSASPAWAQQADLVLTGAVPKPLSVTLADLKAMPRHTVSVLNERMGKTDVYSGVLLTELLARGGAPHGRELRGPALATVLVAEASDGYRAVFALAELDAGIGDAQVLVADELAGAPLDAKQGPLKLIVPRDKRPERSVRMLKALRMVEAVQ